MKPRHEFDSGEASLARQLGIALRFVAVIAMLVILFNV